MKKVILLTMIAVFCCPFFVSAQETFTDTWQSIPLWQLPTSSTSETLSLPPDNNTINITVISSYGTISITSNIPMTQVLVFDLTGKFVCSRTELNTTALIISDMNPGVYYLHIYLNGGDMVGKRTVVPDKK